MAKKKVDKAKENIQAVEEALSRTEMFLEKHQKPILYIVGGILIIVAGYFGYQKFIKIPKNKEAQEKMFVAEKYWQKDSLTLALNGDGLNPGFLEIIDDYKRTPSGNLARYYAATIYLKQGQFNEVVSTLKNFKAHDPMVGPTALRMLGDAYLELGDHEKAVSNYLEAAKKADNDFLTPEFLMRAGNTYELKKDYKKALEAYTRIKKEYPQSFRSNNIEKYMARAELLLEHGGDQ